MTASGQVRHWGHVIQMGESQKENAMFLKSRLVKASVMLVALLCARSALVQAGSTGTTVSITATVDSFTEWANTIETIAAGDWTNGVDGHIAHANTILTASKTLTLFTNQNVTIIATSSTNGMLTNGSQTLDTFYQLTGPEQLEFQYGVPVPAFIFVMRPYPLTHLSGTGQYVLTLGVTAFGPNAPDAGDYTADVVLTAAW